MLLHAYKQGELTMTQSCGMLAAVIFQSGILAKSVLPNKRFSVCPPLLSEFLLGPLVLSTSRSAPSFYLISRKLYYFRTARCEREFCRVVEVLSRSNKVRVVLKTVRAPPATSTMLEVPMTHENRICQNSFFY